MSLFLTGDRALAKALDGLSKESSVKRVVRPAVRAALSPVNKAAKRNARNLKRLGDSNQTKALAKAIGITPTRKSRQRGQVEFMIRARGGSKFAVPDPVVPGRMRQPEFYQHLVELGTRRMEARPFLGPAWEATKQIAGTTLVAKVRENLPKEVARQALKARSAG